MKRSVFCNRLNVLRRKLTNIAADTLWIIQPENRRYLSGFKAADMQITESSGSLIINKHNALLITDPRYTVEARRDAGNFKVITVNSGIITELPELLEDMNAEVLGFEEDYITWSMHGQMSRRLKALSRPVRLTPLKGLVDSMRIVKDKSEIKLMEASSNMMTAILNEVVEVLKPGLTEREIAWHIMDLARESGADGLAFPSIVASGPNSALPHAVPTERKIRAGEPIIFDVGIKVDGYCCDMTRTIFLGSPSIMFKKIYMTVREAQLCALREVKPGVESTYPDQIARSIIRDAGFGGLFGHALGHGVGLAAHEAPRLAPKKPVNLEEGMVVTIEPGIYLPGKGGVRLEEMVVIEKDGPRILTKDDHYYEF